MILAHGPTVGLIQAMGSRLTGFVGSLHVAVTVLVDFTTDTEKVLTLIVKSVEVEVVVTLAGVFVIVGVIYLQTIRKKLFRR